MPAKTNFTSKITIPTTAAVVAVVAVVLTSIAYPLARADQPATRRSPVASWWHNQTRKYMNRRRAAAKPATAARQAAPIQVPTVVTQPMPVPEVLQAAIQPVRKTTPAPAPVVRQAPTPIPTPVVRKAPAPPRKVVRRAPQRRAPQRRAPQRRAPQRRAPQRLVRHAPAAAAPAPRIRQVVAQAPRMPANQQPPSVPTTAGFARLSAPLYPSPVQNIPHQVGGVVITNPALAPHEMLYEHEYRALYPPFYYRVKGWWAWTPFGVESHDKWELMGTEVRVRYKSRPSLLQRIADPFIEPFLD